MNYVSPGFLAQSHRAFDANRPPTLADLKSRVEADLSLDSILRRDLLSALNRLPGWANRPLAEISATPTAVRELFDGVSAAKAGVSAKTVKNVRSLVGKLMERYGAPLTAVTRKVPPTPAWRALLDSIVVSHHRHALGRLATFSSVMEIAPPEVTTTTLLGLHHALDAEERVKSPRSIIENTISNWNRCRRSVQGWPDVVLESPFKKPPVTLTLSAFPASFQKDVARWQTQVTDEVSLDDDAPDEPLVASTVDLRLTQIRQFASANVHRGELELDNVTNLSILFPPPRFKSALRWFLNRPHDKDSLLSISWLRRLSKLRKNSASSTRKPSMS